MIILAISPEMADRIDPQLKRNEEDSVQRLRSNSPAHNKLLDTPFAQLITVDIDGEERGPNTDAGCDQFSEESITKPMKRITTEDVGPKATTSLGDSPAWNLHPQIS